MENRQQKRDLLNNGIFDLFQNRCYQLSKVNLYNEIKDFSYFNDIVATDSDFHCCQQMKQAKKKQRQKVTRHVDYLVKLKGYTAFFITLTFNNDLLKNRKYLKDQNGNFVLDKHGKRVWDIKDLTKQDWDILRRKIFKYIGNNVEDIILNVDYGKEHDRLHAHGIVIIKDTDYKWETDFARDENGNAVLDSHGKKKYYKKVVNDYLLEYEKNVGFYTLEKIRFSSNDKYNETQIAKLSEYLNKLVSHSIKVKQSYITTKKNTRYQRYQVFCRDNKRIINACGIIQTYDYLINTYNAFYPVNDSQENEFNLRRIKNHEKDLQDKKQQRIKELKNRKRESIFDTPTQNSCLNITPYQVRGADFEKLPSNLTKSNGLNVEQLKIATF